MSSTLLIVDADGVTFRKKSSNKKKSNKSSKSLFGKIYKKFQKYYEGKISFEDLQYEDLNPKYLEQINFRKFE